MGNKLFSTKIYFKTKLFSYFNLKMKKIVFNKSNSFQFSYMKTKKNLFSPKFCFQNLIVLKCFKKTFFSVFQPFYEIPKRLKKQFCSCFKIQNVHRNAKPKMKRLQKRSFSKTTPITIYIYIYAHHYIYI